MLSPSDAALRLLAHSCIARTAMTVNTASNAIAAEYSRHFESRVTYCGDFLGQYGPGQPYPQSVTPESLLAIVDNLQPGVTGLACHPGLNDESGSIYGSERDAEVRALCDPRVRERISEKGIELVSFDVLRFVADATSNPSTV